MPECSVKVSALIMVEHCRTEIDCKKFSPPAITFPTRALVSSRRKHKKRRHDARLLKSTGRLTWFDWVDTEKDEAKDVNTFLVTYSVTTQQMGG